MKYKDELLTQDNFNDTITGKENHYPCYVFDYNQINNVSEIEDFVGLTSYPYPSEGASKIMTQDQFNLIQRHWIKINFYKNLEDFLTDDFKRYGPFHYWLIPSDSENGSKIIKDIQNKLEFKVQ